jgi:tetratricopeptide (TPR) repeat protein
VLYLRRGNFDQAIADCDVAIRLEPDKAEAYGHRGKAWAGKGDTDRALADYEAAVRIDPNNPTLLRDQGIVWRRLGDPDRALAAFDHAIRLGFSDASAYNERGQVWLEKGRHERAIADFNQALKIDPTLVSALINRGIAWRSKGELDRAIADFGRVISIDPAYPRPTTIAGWRGPPSRIWSRRWPNSPRRGSCCRARCRRRSFGEDLAVSGEPIVTRTPPLLTASAWIADIDRKNRIHRYEYAPLSRCFGWKRRRSRAAGEKMLAKVHTCTAADAAAMRANHFSVSLRPAPCR